ncbi:MAG: hypothetical protein HC825_09365 [Oscillatoriales cyanobacterium RM1_1_9]|nr:hypothetical protein [Oscillatoriales cyanobacterium SM2_3_0]NJO45002.1 hypothetical protein [Oscillatoriales cyanobacterium RM2_1_1]NJO71813.1 hypothetical protein [Oscillatoriales cyanobacterium RM1_1_9]
MGISSSLFASLLVVTAPSLTLETVTVEPQLLAGNPLLPAPEVMIDTVFRSRRSLPLPPRIQQRVRVLKELPSILGTYQGVQTLGNGNYTANFERGSVPVAFTFHADGRVKTVGVSCPETNPQNWQGASQTLKQMFAACIK